MIAKYFGRAFILLVVLIGGFFMSTIALPDCNPQFRKVSEDGLGTGSSNSVIWSLQEFNGRLYAGTSNVFIGAEIHRYDGQSWERVVQNGLGNINNEGIRHMAIYKGVLYAGTVNVKNGSEIWRSADGVNWEKVMTGGFGSRTAESVRALEPFKGYLYAGVSEAGNDKPGKLFRTTDGANWEPVVVDGLGDPDNDSFHAMEKFHGFLYTLIRHGRLGPPQIWRTADGINFRQVVGPYSATPAGFGVPNTQVFYHIKAYKSYIYVGTANYDGFSLHRSSDGIVWEEVGREGLGTPGNGQESFRNPGNIFGWRFEIFENDLWLGIFNYTGARAWKTDNGLDWVEMVGPASTFAPAGFGNPWNWGVRSLEEFNDKLYLGTAQCILVECLGVIPGAAIWEWPGEACEP